MLRAARAKTLATQDWTALLGLKRNGVRLAALIANNLEPLAIAASTAA
jgi:adenine/guanine phosphoribosyltransferase-like PRPP-binding protein